MRFLMASALERWRERRRRHVYGKVKPLHEPHCDSVWMVAHSEEAALPGSGTVGRLVSGDQLSSSVYVTLLVSLLAVPLPG
jgi:hypothetical protein